MSRMKRGGADCVSRDTWVSMGSTEASRRKQLCPMRGRGPLKKAAAGLFMHCLPAYRHESPRLIEWPQSIVWDEAENRLTRRKRSWGCLG